MDKDMEMEAFKKAYMSQADRNVRISELKIGAFAVVVSLIVVGSLCLAFYEAVIHELPNRY